jgi:outer membrane protein OmpA-like peptidoglycan-associated protein
MKKRQALLWMACFVFFMVSAVQAASDINDCKGCKDHPLLTRMLDYRLSIYKTKEFEQHKFQDENGKYVAVEGAYYFLEYDVNRNVKHASELQIIRNHTNAIEKIGGKLLRESGGHAYYTIKKNGKETWVHLNPVNRGKLYRLIIIEKQAMEQDVVADADAAQMDRVIKETGKIALYGIYFDTNKANMKPESEPTLKEITKFLKDNPSIKLYVVGHTDSDGRFEHNEKLSEARAKSVVKELTEKYSIATARLKGYGVGPLCPVQSNKATEGKAKNRRVELVEQ